MNNKEFKEGTDYIIENRTLKIREGIKAIPIRSFDGNTKFNKIVFPSTLIYIGESAFRGCSFITEVSIPNSARYISNQAFKRCKIERLTLGENVTYIGYDAFSENNINSIINNSTKLKIVDSNAFANNKELHELDVSDCDGDVYFDDYAFGKSGTVCELYNNIGSSSYNFNFYGEYEEDDSLFTGKICSSKNTENYTYTNGVLKIKDGVEVIGNFSDLTDCKRIEMPDSVVMILTDSFRGLNELEDVKFSKSLIIIEANAFTGCNLKKNGITLPNSLCSINYTSFLNNTGLKEIKLPDTTIFENTFVSDRFYYSYYPNDFEEVIKENGINIAKLLEEDKAKLDALGLLPTTIKTNTKLNNKISYSQSLLLIEFFINFILNTEYDENKNIQFITDLLKLKEIDVSDMHEVVEYLFEKRRKKTIYLLISYGYDFRSNFMINKAIRYSMTDMIDVFLLLGEDINEVNINETTPLSTACIIGNYNIVNYLIEKGAAINMLDRNNKKAIDYAIENGDNDLVNLLNSYADKTSTESDIEVIKKILENK